VSKGFLHGSGGVGIKRKSGSTMPVNGTANVNTGFKPDLVVFKSDTFFDGTMNNNPVFAFPFCEDNRGALHCITFGGESASSANVVVVECAQTASGFSVTVYGKNSSNQTVPLPTAPAIPYIAVKYT
jgi:hypothetical protein